MWRYIKITNFSNFNFFLFYRLKFTFFVNNNIKQKIIQRQCLFVVIEQNLNHKQKDKKLNLQSFIRSASYKNRSCVQIGAIIMYCKKCGKVAFTRISYARMNLCKEHFIEFFQKRIGKTRKRYKLFKPGDKLLIAVSGGKDSIALLHAISSLYREENELNVLFINLGIDTYSNQSEEIVKNITHTLDISLSIYNLKKEIGKTLPELNKITHRQICSLCGVIKRYVINKVAYERNFDVILTGHTIEDITAFAAKHLLTGDFESVIRLVPRTETKKELKMIGRAKPLYETYERETLFYCLANKLSFIETHCPFSIKTPIVRWKMAINDLDSKEPGFKILLARTIAKKTIPLLKDYYNNRMINNKKAINFCKVCGMPTNSDICAFCRITKKEELDKFETNKKE